MALVHLVGRSQRNADVGMAAAVDADRGRAQSIDIARWVSGYRVLKVGYGLVSATRLILWLAGLTGLLLLGGCSFKQMAVDRVGDALAGSGTTFAADDDPELIKAAAPFSLKLMESILDESPGHQELLLAAARGYTQYAYAFVQQDAERLAESDFEGYLRGKARARRLYLRARHYGLRALEVAHTGIASALRRDPEQAVQRATANDVAALYWTAAAWAGAISLSKDDPDLIADLPIVEALIYRALALDESFDQGAIHTFLISFEQARSTAGGDPHERSRRHFERALALAGDRQIGCLVVYAEAVSVPRGDRSEFERLLGQAVLFDVDAHPAYRLANTIMRRRAEWLLGRVDVLFLN